MPDEDITGPEAVLEVHKPPRMIPRAAAVFMVDDPDMIDAAVGYDDHVYARPFLEPDEDEVGDVVFSEGLVSRGGDWLLHFGMADSRVGVAPTCGRRGR